MVDAALKRLKGDETKRRDDLSTLKNDIAVAEEDYIRRTTNHWTHLPVELFADIAQMLVDEDIKHLIPLSHVCKDWRRVVEDSAGLWSTLVIGRARPWAKAERWVKHSKGVIHSLVVPYESHERGKWDGDGLSGIRWDQLRAFKAEHWNLCSHLKAIGLEPGVLTSLTRYDYTNEVRTPQIPPFHSSWPIQHLALAHVKLSQPLIDLLEGSIVTLSLSRMSFPSSGVQLSGSLESLVLDSTDGPAFKELPDELPDMHHLTLRQMGKHTLSLLLVKMPYLTSLRLHDCSSIKSEHLESLGKKSSGHLTTLVLDSVAIDSPKHLVNFLRSNPQLTTLELTRMHGVVAVIEALASTENPSDSSEAEPVQAMCPKLNHLNLSNCQELGTGPIFRLIKSRNGASAPVDDVEKISALILDGCEKIEAEWLPWFRKHVGRFSCVYWTKKSGRYRAAA
ncbi:hypothetical protein D9611_008810 [Ephemerocybe angulata]|uniref:F-box domain-containing protein n=1 Tax=Ephemerocybe angulata TaxID=980116 RepID=A0A8H5CDD4_9AGAR|nr:hypothetical protein D9611_008810 [Tulosesus angulatus]